jgi:hypothetical protein
MGSLCLQSCIYDLELEIIISIFERSICLVSCQPQMCNDQYEEKCLGHWLSTWTLHLHNFMAFIPRMSLKKLFLIQNQLLLKNHFTWELIDWSSCLQIFLFTISYIYFLSNNLLNIIFLRIYKTFIGHTKQNCKIYYAWLSILECINIQ